MRRCLWGVLLLAVCAGNAPDAGPSDRGDNDSPAPSHDWAIIPGERIGPVFGNSSESDLLALLGADRLVRREIYLAEGFCTDGSVLYPDSPDAVDIAWADSARTRPAFLRIHGKDARWETPAGVRIGSTLEELEAIRGDVLTFSGFGWDYGGGTEWYETDETRTAGLQLSPDSASWSSASDDAAWGEILGDRPVRSDHPLVRTLNIVVESIGIGFNAPFEEHECRTLPP